MAREILNTITDFNIIAKTGYIIGDNASSNDTLVKVLGRKLQELGFEFDWSKRRIRCSGHIINLSLDAFLFASTIEALKAAIEAAKNESDITVVDMLQEQLQTKQGKKKSKQPQAGWGAIPGLSKLHDIAVYIRSSTILSDEWESLAGVQLGIDNATRWNSWFRLLKIALQKQEKLMTFCNNHHKALGESIIQPAEWETLKFTFEFLQPFSQATLSQEKNWSSLDSSLFIMDILFRHYEQAKVCYI
jgi:hypothetical protein